MGGFRPVMPSVIRLLAGIIVLIVVQSIVLGFPGITTQIVPGTAFSIASFVIFTLGLIIAAVVLKFGTQLANVVSDSYRTYKAYAPILAWVFQLTAIYILYSVSKTMVSGFFASAPWAYPLIFLAMALIPTIKVVVAVVHALEGQNVHKQTVTRDQF
ncbi:MAG: hypothetical protein AUF79_04790 [Crenarchaeota archaeon 13_1_20CM_2_51_8]|nr:MAG: hypothetical protein AUF79_04790 [Crenarchaeota archaeon 13_1_20CM_2_51_8]